MAEPNKQYTGDGSDNLAQGAKNIGQAAKQFGQQAAQQAATAGAEATAAAACKKGIGNPAQGLRNIHHRIRLPK